MPVLVRFSALALMLLLLVTPAVAEEAKAPSDTAVKVGETYIIGPSDVLEIIVWREDSLSRGEVLVRPDGMISMPLVDDVKAAGMTPMQLKEELAERLKKYVEAPMVFITIKDPRSHTFNLLGNVMAPGMYPMLKPTTVLQALALAGGFNEWASKDNVMVVRGHGADQKVHEFDYSEVIDGENVDQNILLAPGDVIVVP